LIFIDWRKKTYFSSRNPFPSLSNIDTLRKDKYDANLIKSINAATLIKSLEKCSTINIDMFHIIENQNAYEK
jgi:hypothetical protein